METGLSASEAAPRPILVIGAGSTLRGDDAIGRYVVESIAELARPNVVAISVTQLVPELAAEIASARAVIVVDACADERSRTIDVRELTGGAEGSRLSHHSSAWALLTMARACYQASPAAWLVTVPAERFELNDQMSPAGKRNVRSAVGAIERLIEQVQLQSV
jgi:hydrogenase maturation protease